MESTNISLYQATLNDKALLDNLIQLYLHDLSEYMNLEVGPKGIYENNLAQSYVGSFEKTAYIIHAEYHIIGFVLTEKASDYIKLNDLFVLNMWRGKGVGSAVIEILLKQGKSIKGKYHSKNKLGQFFWNNIALNSNHKVDQSENAGVVHLEVAY